MWWKPQKRAILAVKFEAGDRAGEFPTTKLKHIKFDGYVAVIHVDGKTGSRPIRLIESASELANHPEHARLNMEKWKEMGFDMCHCWSESKRLKEIYDSQVNDTENVKAFVI